MTDRQFLFFQELFVPSTDPLVCLEFAEIARSNHGRYEQVKTPGGGSGKGQK